VELLKKSSRLWLVRLVVLGAIALGCTGDGRGSAATTASPAIAPATPAVTSAAEAPAPTASPPTPIPTRTPTVTPKPEASAAATSEAASEPTPEATPGPAVQPADSLPIIDLHFHPEPGWGDLTSLFDRLRVRAAGSGASGPDSIALDLAEQHPDRVLAFAGGHELRQLILEHGEAALTIEVPAAARYLEEVGAALREGRFVGLGELLVNNRSSYIAGSPPYHFPADSPLMVRLFELSARYSVPLSVHMDAEAAAVEQMERLLASNREGTWLWAHTGHVAEPALLARLLRDHPNLYCELSYRLSISPSRTAIPMDQGGRLRPEWRELLEAFPDRFVIGTDLSYPSHDAYEGMIAFWRGLLGQLSPQVAAQIAHRNAERLLRLPPER
jgi:hypothetical protein